ncbi:hypothetical protein FOL47_000569 [Perkinsus chesapeaki]|uniref:Uncharacterized protein n=1 Tax=Perkinsus chesapeaki TaxID=330153 RepID=A0A7J6N1U4_PERCH|nr:hypothetical protein FOL47_000569 [Perkinsus chesapeaki]
MGPGSNAMPAIQNMLQSIIANAHQPQYGVATPKGAQAGMRPTSASTAAPPSLQQQQQRSPYQQLYFANAAAAAGGGASVLPKAASPTPKAPTPATTTPTAAAGPASGSRPGGHTGSGG